MAKIKILVIDDDIQIVKNLSEVLTYAGFEVFTAAEGNSGIQLAGTLRPDIILCDIMMPGMDGFQVLRQLSEDESTKQIPFLFLTAVAGSSDIRHGMALGADDYITKPYRVKELISAIYARLERIKVLKAASTAEPQQVAETETRLTYEQNIMLTDAKSPHYLKIRDIVAISADGDYTNIYLTSGQKLYIRRLLGDWEKALPPKKFFRIHRSTLVNLEYIDKIENWFKRSFKVYMKYINQDFIVSERAAVSLKEELSI